MKLGKFFKNIFKGVGKAVSTVAPVLAVASIFSPTLFGLTTKKGIVGSLAKGIVGLTRTKGKVDPKKVTALLLGASALQSAQQQRAAEKALQEEMKAYQQFAAQNLQPMSQMMNQLLAMYGGLLFPFGLPPQVGDLEEWYRQNFPTVR